MIKSLAKLFGTLFVLPLIVRYEVFRRLTSDAQAFSGVSEYAARRPGLLGIYCRQALYKRLLAATGQDIHFGYQTLLSKPNARIADRVYFGRFCTVGWVEIEQDVRIADGAQLLSGSNQHGSLAQGVDHDQPKHRPIRIGQGAWIGANAVVMADVGVGAIVGAGAVVTKPVPSGETVAGVPAKPIGSNASAPRRAA